MLAALRTFAEQAAASGTVVQVTAHANGRQASLIPDHAWPDVLLMAGLQAGDPDPHLDPPAFDTPAGVVHVMAVPDGRGMLPTLAEVADYLSGQDAERPSALG